MTNTAPKSALTATKYGRITTPEGHQLYFPEDRLKLIAGLLRAGRSVALIGEPGSGKTALARAILHQALKAHAARTGEDTAFFQMDFAGIMSGDMLDGEKTIGDGGKLELIPSEHLKAVRSASRGIMTGYVADELNRGAPQGTNKLLRQYAEPYEYYSDLDGVLRFDPQRLMTIATLNVGFGFTGTSRTDAALIDRLYPVLVQAPPASIVESILNDRYSGRLDARQLQGILNAYDKSRGSEDAYKMGVRDAIMLADGVTDGGLKLREAVEILIGGKVQMNGLDTSSMESLVTVVSAA